MRFFVNYGGYEVVALRLNEVPSSYWDKYDSAWATGHNEDRINTANFDELRAMAFDDNNPQGGAYGPRHWDWASSGEVYKVQMVVIPASFIVRENELGAVGL